MVSVLQFTPLITHHLKLGVNLRWTTKPCLLTLPWICMWTQHWVTNLVYEQVNWCLVMPTIVANSKLLQGSHGVIKSDPPLLNRQSWKSFPRGTWKLSMFPIGVNPHPYSFCHNFKHNLKKKKKKICFIL